MNATVPGGSIPIYQVDAFSATAFAGNPAAVCPLETWLPDAVLQSIAQENNLSETAFFIPKDDHYELRWFTPTHEVQLCGHATLASAVVLWGCLGASAQRLRFITRHSGELAVMRDDGWYWLDFPAQPAQSQAAPDGLLDAFNIQPAEVHAGPNWLLRYDNEQQIRALAPDLRRLASLPDRCVIATAPADAPGVDFVSRFFCPNFGVDEDPVTGSAHCMLAPYWAGVLGREALEARQISARGGVVRCRLAGDRVMIGGQAHLYLEGRIHL